MAAALGVAVLLGAGPVNAAPAAQAAQAAPAAKARPAQPAAAAARPLVLAPQAPGTVLAVPVELKEPYLAYSLGMIPFFTMNVANYVGTDRLSWKPAQPLADVAWRQGLTDWGLLLAGTTLFALTGGAPEAVRGQGMFLGLTALVAIPASHLWIYAPWWGEQAADFNRRQLLRYGFPAEPASWSEDAGQARTLNDLAPR